MRLSEFRKLIREEVRKVVNEVEQTGKYYYMQFNGTMQPMGPTAVDPTGKDRSNRVSRGPLNKPTDILNVRRFPKNSWREMSVYNIMINSKPGYVLISADNRNKWAIIQTDEKFNASVTAAANTDDEQEINNRYRYSYKMAFDAVTSAAQKGEKITPEEFGKAINEQTLNEGTGISEQMWVKELTGKTIKKGFVKTNGPDLMLQMTDGTTYTFKQLTALIKWDEKSS